MKSLCVLSACLCVAAFRADIPVVRDGTAQAEMAAMGSDPMDASRHATIGSRTLKKRA